MGPRFNGVEDHVVVPVANATLHRFNGATL